MNKTIPAEPDKLIFKDRAREAQYWEKQFDKTWSNGKKVKTKFAKNLSETLNIRLNSESLYYVKNLARKKGLGPTQLIRMWIMEKINNKHIPSVGI